MYSWLETKNIELLEFWASHKENIGRQGLLEKEARKASNVNMPLERMLLASITTSPFFAQVESG